jgi:hypothetical protein
MILYLSKSETAFSHHSTAQPAPAWTKIPAFIAAIDPPHPL